MADERKSLNSFLASVKSLGTSRPNRFEVNIFSAGEQPKNATDDVVSLRCQSVDLPGRNMETTPNENVYGPVYEIASGLTLAGTISMTFLLDQELNIKRYFDNWQKEMYNPETYDIKYYSTYVRDMEIKQLSGEDEIVFNCRVLEVYPKTIDLINLDHNYRSEASMLNVTMAYRDWEETTISNAKPAIASPAKSIQPTTETTVTRSSSVKILSKNGQIVGGIVNGEEVDAMTATTAYYEQSKQI